MKFLHKKYWHLNLDLVYLVCACEKFLILKEIKRKKLVKKSKKRLTLRKNFGKVLIVLLKEGSAKKWTLFEEIKKLKKLKKLLDLN